MSETSYENAPVLDLKRTDHRRMEAEAVVENILGSMLGSMEAHLKQPEKRKRPKPDGYTKIMLADLNARVTDLYLRFARKTRAKSQRKVMRMIRVARRVAGPPLSHRISIKDRSPQERAAPNSTNGDT